MNEREKKRGEGDGRRGERRKRGKAGVRRKGDGKVGGGEGKGK